MSNEHKTIMASIERERVRQQLTVRDMCRDLPSSNIYWYALHKSRDSRFSNVAAFARRVGLTLTLVKK